MAGSPPIKVYRGKEYVASCQYFEDAAALAGMSSDSTVRMYHRHVIWTEGAEEISAADSWDAAAEIMRERASKITR